VIYSFISERDDYAVAKWVRFFQVSKSGYYAYVKRRPRRDKEKESLKTEIKRIFIESGGTYGPDRICGFLRKKGYKTSYGKASKYMAELGLNSVHNRHKTRSITDSRKARAEGYPNLIAGQTFKMPRIALCSDITYLKSGEGWLYLCSVKDIVSGEILGEATSENMKKELVIRAFLNAQARYKLPKETIFHSDRGSQYTSKEFMNTLKIYGFKQSFSRIGMPGDNAWAESFFATLKKECIHFKHFATREELRQTIFAWIHGFYNAKRIQKRLGYISPKEYAFLILKGADKQAA
jgi:putative transposase